MNQTQEPGNRAAVKARAAAIVDVYALFSFASPPTLQPSNVVALMITRLGAGSDDGDLRCDLFQGAPHSLKARRQKGNAVTYIGCTKTCINAKLLAVTDADGRAIQLFMTAG